MITLNYLSVGYVVRRNVQHNLFEIKGEKEISVYRARYLVGDAFVGIISPLKVKNGTELQLYRRTGDESVVARYLHRFGGVIEGCFIEDVCALVGIPAALRFRHRVVRDTVAVDAFGNIEPCVEIDVRLV